MRNFLCVLVVIISSNTYFMYFGLQGKEKLRIMSLFVNENFATFAFLFFHSKIK